MLTTLTILIHLLVADFSASHLSLGLTDVGFRQDTQTIVADPELVELCTRAACLSRHLLSKPLMRLKHVGNG